MKWVEIFREDATERQVEDLKILWQALIIPQCEQRLWPHIDSKVPEPP